MRKPRRSYEADVVELLHGIGRMVQQIDGRLEKIVTLLEEEENGRDDDH